MVCLIFHTAIIINKKNWRITIKLHFKNLSIFLKKIERIHVLGAPSPVRFCSLFSDKNNANNNNSNISIKSAYVEASSSAKNILENFRSQLELIRKEKHDFYLKHKYSEYKV